jgi:predicted ATPase
MLKNLQIENFKGWEDTGTIQMAPITLFFGTNSSGKSSIGQFLMYLKQTVDIADRKVVLYSGGKNSPVQLGSFKDVIFQHNTNKEISFWYDWKLSNNLKIKDATTNKSYIADCIKFSAEIDSQSEQKISVKEFVYKLSKEGEKKFEITMQRDELSKYKIQAEDYKLTKPRGRSWPFGIPVRFYGFPDEAVARYENAEFMQQLNLTHEQLFRSIYYLGPLRTKTERIYSWAGNEPDSVGYEGENTIAAMLAAKPRKISFGYKRPTYIFEEIIARELQKMELINKFKVTKIDNRQEYEVKVQTKGSQIWVDLPDVGFGVSQVLPVLVQCFYAPANSIIIMEQPEIHLHPAAQSILADVMIDVINSKENGKDRNIQLIIETHSEHFLRRLQRRIAENALDKSSISAYFAKTDRKSAKLEALKIDLYGNITNWPENFFGDEMEDVIAQSKAALHRRRDDG